VNFRRSVFFLFGLLVTFLTATPCQAAMLTDLRFWSAPDHTRVVLDLTDAVEYETSFQEKPPQSSVELKGVILFTKKREFVVDDRQLSKINLLPIRSGWVKLVLHQKRPLNTNIFLLKPYLDKPHRLVIDVVDPEQEKKEQDERQRQKNTKTKQTRTVVIDPGHGGEDPGAIGPQRSMEKNVVLAIGTKLLHALDQQNHVRSFLSRKGDYFVPLEHRARIARDYGADLFVSLHADASFNPQARGSSVYCLSLSGATDEAARILADKENMSNVLGGAVSKPATLAKDPNLNQILLDLMQNNSMKESLRLSEILLDDLKEVNRVKYQSYRQANFAVLRAPDIVSVLVEMAYVTNKEDEQLLNRPDFQDRMAKTLGSSILKYFKDSL